jgi:hypothetical protein
MKKILVVLLCSFMVIGLVGITFADGGLPEAKGQAVYDYVTKTNPYQQWSLFPGKDKLYTGKHPHGALLTTYVNDIALAGINDRIGTLDNGSIIVKENYMPNKTLGAITVMYRVAGYDPNGGDWFWAKYAANGSIAKEGKVNGCINCHAAVINNDWVFTGPVK